MHDRVLQLSRLRLITRNSVLICPQSVPNQYNILNKKVIKSLRLNDLGWVDAASPGLEPGTY